MSRIGKSVERVNYGQCLDEEIGQWQLKVGAIFLRQWKYPETVVAHICDSTEKWLHYALGTVTVFNTYELSFRKVFSTLSSSLKHASQLFLRGCSAELLCRKLAHLPLHSFPALKSWRQTTNFPKCSLHLPMVRTGAWHRAWEQLAAMCMLQARLCANYGQKWSHFYNFYNYFPR